MLIDSHCHLDDPRFGGQQAILISAATRAGVTEYLLPGTTASNWQPIADLAARYTKVHPAYGLHPWFIDEHADNALSQLTRWMDNHPAVAIGECGLDFSRDDRDRQERLFTAQIAIAEQAGLPLIIHSYKAMDRVIQLLRQPQSITGVIHRFSGSLQQAEQLMELGFYIGVAAGITYSSQAKLRRTIATLPLNRLLLESDAPDLPPAGIGHRLNAPEYLPMTLAALAELLGEEPTEVARQTTMNTRRLFAI